MADIHPSEAIFVASFPFAQVIQLWPSASYALKVLYLENQHSYIDFCEFLAQKIKLWTFEPSLRLQLIRHRIQVTYQPLTYCFGKTAIVKLYANYTSQ